MTENIEEGFMAFLGDGQEGLIGGLARELGEDDAVDRGGGVATGRDVGGGRRGLGVRLLAGADLDAAAGEAGAERQQGDRADGGREVGGPGHVKLVSSVVLTWIERRKRRDAPAGRPRPGYAAITDASRHPHVPTEARHRTETCAP